MTAYKAIRQCACWVEDPRCSVENFIHLFIQQIFLGIYSVSDTAGFATTVKNKTDTFHPFTESVVSWITCIFIDRHTPCKIEFIVPILQMRKLRLKED